MDMESKDEMINISMADKHISRRQGQRDIPFTARLYGVTNPTIIVMI